MAKSVQKSALPEVETLSLAEQVAQMFVVRASGHLFDHEIQYPDWEPPAATLQHYIQDLGVGGVILPVGGAAELAARSQQVQSWAKIPLLIAADVEEGVGQRFTGATWFPPPMAIGAIADQDMAKAEHYARELGAHIAQESLAIGLNWVLAPVVDVNNNPDNPVINVRSFGQTPAKVSQLATAFIRGAHHWPVLTCAKHFPGHGDTAVDSHLELPVLPHSPERLAEIELPPFAAAIAAGVDAVMSAHLAIPAWDQTFPATLSPAILTGQLRQKLGFEKLIVTDALVMGAIAKRYGATEAPILALEAGADILLMPVDPGAAIQAVCDAVKSGRISATRIRESVERIWQAKRKVCFSEKPGTESPVYSRLSQLANPATLNIAEQILQDSLQVGGSLPLHVDRHPNVGQFRNLVIVDDLLRCDVLGHHVPAIAIPERLGYQLQLIDRHRNLTPDSINGDSNLPTLLQVFIRGNPFRGSAGLSEAAHDWFKKLLKTNQLQGLVIYGSPYILDQFLPALPAEIPYVFTYGQMSAAQAIALETLFGLPTSRSYQPSSLS